MNGAYKVFKMDGQKKVDVDSYINRVKPQFCRLVEDYLNALDASKVQMHMWVM